MIGSSQWQHERSTTSFAVKLGSIVYRLCGLRQTMNLLPASISSYLKWNNMESFKIEEVTPPAWFRG